MERLPSKTPQQDARPVIKQNDTEITGKKETPPSRDTGDVCTFRSSGMSNSLRLYDTIRMLGIINNAIKTAQANPPARKRKSLIYLGNTCEKYGNGSSNSSEHIEVQVHNHQPQ